MKIVGTPQSVVMHCQLQKCFFAMLCEFFAFFCMVYVLVYLCTCVHSCAFTDASPSLLRCDKIDHSVHTMNFFTFHRTLSGDIAFVRAAHKQNENTDELSAYFPFPVWVIYHTLALLIDSKALNSQSW